MVLLQPGLRRTTMIVGVSRGHRDAAQAEHWLATFGPAPLEAATHLVRSPHPHVAVRLRLAPDVPAPPTPPEFTAAAAEAAAAHGGSGRAVIFAGAASVGATVTVADLLAGTAVEAVRVLGGGPPRPTPRSSRGTSSARSGSPAR